MKKIISIILLIVLNISQLFSYSPITESEKLILSFWDRKCKNIKQTDIPTIFIPWILASWYSEEWYKETKVKRWIPDPITHSYDTLFYGFKQNWYSLKDVFYQDEFATHIIWNPKQSLYLFWYDWKKDNKVTAKLLSNLVLQIRDKYLEINWCDIWAVNIIWHSMWWLVARAMLENMCADENEYIPYYSDKSLKNWELKNFISTNCYNYTRVNKLITISTPHRGSPRSLPMWEKGDIEKVEDILTSLWLKSQLSEKKFYEIQDYTFDKQLYNRIHWFDTNIPSGIVTIWQLLPDLQNKNTYNNSLRYLYSLWYLDEKNNLVWLEKRYLENNLYPKNSFLEELNLEKNINIMFSNIIGTYTSYYSKQTWKTKTNNITEFELANYTLKDNNEYYKTKIITSTKDIYDKYSSKIPYDYYIINNVIQNHKWLWWDWTVPSANLLLVPNDSVTWKEVSNNKFQSVEMKCYNWDIMMDIYTEYKDYYNDLYRWFWYNNRWILDFWKDTEFEICSHTKTPIGLAVQVFQKISWNNIALNSNWEYDFKKERSLLLQYIWYTDYISHSISDSNSKKIYDFTSLESYYTKDDNSDKVEYWYHPVLKNDTMQKELDKLENNIYNDTDVSLNFWSASDSLLRYEVLSPINLIIEDELWRKIWIDPETGMIINEIPWAWTSGNTEDSWEPEFFLIPRTGTWQILNKIHSYATGDWEYHIVLNEIKSDTFTWNIDETASFVIEWTAKKWIVENYLVWIEWSKANYKFIDSEVSEILKKVELKEKYKDILAKLYEVLDKKYTKKKKIKLKQNLLKFKESKSERLKDEKLSFLIDMIIEHIK